MDVLHAQALVQAHAQEIVVVVVEVVHHLVLAVQEQIWENQQYKRRYG